MSQFTLWISRIVVTPVARASHPRKLSYVGGQTRARNAVGDSPNSVTEAMANTKLLSFCVIVLCLELKEGQSQGNVNDVKGN